MDDYEAKRNEVWEKYESIIQDLTGNEEYDFLYMLEIESIFNPDLGLKNIPKYLSVEAKARYLNGKKIADRIYDEAFKFVFQLSDEEFSEIVNLRKC